MREETAEEVSFLLFRRRRSMTWISIISESVLCLLVLQQQEDKHATILPFFAAKASRDKSSTCNFQDQQIVRQNDQHTREEDFKRDRLRITNKRNIIHLISFCLWNHESHYVFISLVKITTSILSDISKKKKKKKSHPVSPSIEGYLFLAWHPGGPRVTGLINTLFRWLQISLRKSEKWLLIRDEHWQKSESQSKAFKQKGSMR